MKKLVNNSYVARLQRLIRETEKELHRCLRTRNMDRYVVLEGDIQYYTEELQNQLLEEEVLVLC